MPDDDNIIHVEFGAQQAVGHESSGPTEPLPPGNEEKLAMFEEMIERGTVMVTLDARRTGVDVPLEFGDEPRLNLNFCHTFGIGDFDYDELGVRASLSFGGVDNWCDVPWTSVWMMRSHVENEAMLFPAAIPAEMLSFIIPPDADSEE